MGDGGNHRSGFALLGALFFFLLVAAFLTWMTTKSRVQLNQAEYMKQKAQLVVLASNIDEVLVYSLMTNPNGAAGLPINGKVIGCQMAGDWVSFSIQDHRGLVDLNTADLPMLEAALMAIGQTKEDAVQAAAQIIAFRGIDLLPHDEKPLSGNLKHAPFESVSELTDLPGLDHIDASQFYRVFTVARHSSQLQDTALPDVLLSTADFREDLRGHVIHEDVPIEFVTFAISVRPKSSKQTHSVLAVWDIGGASSGSIRELEQLSVDFAPFVGQSSETSCAQVRGLEFLKELDPP